MRRLSDKDGSSGGLILRAIDFLATAGIMLMVVGIFLFILFTPRSFGATSPLDFGAPTSVTTASESFQGPEQPTLETMDKEPFNLNLDKKHAPRMSFQVKEILGINGTLSENEIRADGTIIYLLAPWR